MKNFVKILSVLLLAALTLSSCSYEKHSASAEAMDTFMKFEYYGSEEVGEKLVSDVKKLDLLFSATDEKSEISSLNCDKSIQASTETLALLAKSLELCKKLGGSLDVTILPVVEKWGFLNQKYRVPSSGEIAEALKKVDYHNVSVSGKTVRLKNNAKLDLGAVAKGYAADRGVELLRKNKVSSAVLNYGGTVAAYGAKPDSTDWKIGIADPDSPSDFVGFVSCRDKIVATSGGYERYFEKNGKRYIHILDPKTGCPADNEVTSVSVISDSGVLCDALSTALFVSGVQGAKEYHKASPDFGFVILTKDKKAYISADLEGSFTLKSEDYELKILGN